MLNLDELNGELKALEDFRQWLTDKLLAVDIDIASNEAAHEAIMEEMEKTYMEGDYTYE